MRCPIVINTSLTIIVLNLLSFFFILPTAAYGTNQHHIEVNKTHRTLSVIDEKNNLVMQFNVALGRGGPGHKKSQGDGVTPLGKYFVVGFNNESDFHYFVRLNYPNNNDALTAYQEQSITFTQLQEILSANALKKIPPQSTSLGGAIGLHGIGDETQKKLLIHSRLNWTQGCIALKNNEIEQLRPFLTLGVHVVIKEQ